MFQNPELNLSTELSDFLFTDKDCSPIKRPLVLRMYARDSKYNIVKCPYCTSEGYSSAALMCPYCKGEGSLFKDKIIEGYIYKTALSKEKHNFGMPSKAGTNFAESSFLVTVSNLVLHPKDKILKLELDANARIKVPINIEHTYNIYATNKAKASTNKIDYNISVLWD